MYVVVETGGKQYKVSKNDTIEVEKLNQPPGKSVRLENVLLCADGKKVEIGRPYLKNVKVSCDVISEIKKDKVISFKYKRRKSHRKKIGHRQKLTRLKVKEISIA